MWKLADIYFVFAYIFGTVSTALCIWSLFSRHWMRHTSLHVGLLAIYTPTKTYSFSDFGEISMVLDQVSGGVLSVLSMEIFCVLLGMAQFHAFPTRLAPALLSIGGACGILAVVTYASLDPLILGNAEFDYALALVGFSAALCFCSARCAHIASNLT